MANVLTLNGGSSSLRFAVYQIQPNPRRTLAGKIERIGLPDSAFVAAGDAPGATGSGPIPAPDHRAAADYLLDWLGARSGFAALAGVGHRVVYGLEHAAPQLITPGLILELKGARSLDPEHMPSELQLIDSVAKRQPGLKQVACFDTAFHHTMPRVARLLPIPRRYAAQGMRRYGFHGLSYDFLMRELARLADPAAQRGRVILAHLGNGASMAAVRDGRSIETSMGFTPASGLVMSTRSGDLDPGVVYHWMRTESISAHRLQDLVNHESGLLGVSETSSDVRDLLARESADGRAAEALELFCYQAKKWIGALAAVLGGVDALVFAGGIGENAPTIRARICAGLEFLGVTLDQERNAANAGLISEPDGRVRVRVIRTDEESMIAAMTARVLGLDPTPED